MIVLGIETSCDETAVAVLKDNEVLSNAVSSSVHLHAEYGGVVPEIASRYHTEFVVPVYREALNRSGVNADDIDLVCVTRGPGLPGSLLVGMSFAKAISYSLDIPIIGVNHIHAHLISCFLGHPVHKKPPFPFLGTVISGGHTSIYICESASEMHLIGQTRDDAAGEAMDKVAKILGLGYPGGPVVEEHASNFHSGREVDLPRGMMKDKHDIDFSFSGMKTAVMYYWDKTGKNVHETDSICYSFQNAVVDVLLSKIAEALEQKGLKRLAVGGGVVNNKLLRESLLNMSKDMGVELFLPEREYCSDNAAMIASLGALLYDSGVRDDYHLNVCPALS